jgi:hypothetical protein
MLNSNQIGLKLGHDRAGDHISYTCTCWTLNTRHVNRTKPAQWLPIDFYYKATKAKQTQDKHLTKN